MKLVCSIQYYGGFLLTTFGRSSRPLATVLSHGPCQDPRTITGESIPLYSSLKTSRSLPLIAYLVFMSIVLPYLCLNTSRPACCRHAIQSICVHPNPRERPAHMVSEVVVHVCVTFSRTAMYVHSSPIRQCSYPIPCAILAVSYVHVNNLPGESELRVQSRGMIPRDTYSMIM